MTHDWPLFLDMLAVWGLGYCTRGAAETRWRLAYALISLANIFVMAVPWPS